MRKIIKNKLRLSLIAGLIFLTAVFLIIFGWSKIQFIIAAVSNSGVMNYGRQANTGMNYVRTYSPPTTVNAEYTDTDTTASAIQFVKSARSPTKEEMFVAHQKADLQLDVLTCTTGCDAAPDWTLRGTLAGMTFVATQRSFDIAYEQLSGRAMIVFYDDPNGVYYCLWDGSAWSPAANCGATFTPGVGNKLDFLPGEVRWIRLVAQGDRLQDKRSDEMLLAVSSTSGLYIARWTGSTWTDISTISSLASFAQPAMDIAWESVSGNGLVLFDKTAIDGTTFYRKYTAGVGWDGSDTAGPDTGSGTNAWTEMASDPMSDRISVIFGETTENDASGVIWKSDGSTAGFTAIQSFDTAIEIPTGKDVATVWSRFNSRALFSYTDNAALTQDVYCWTTAGFTAVTADVGGTGTNDVSRVIYIGSPNNADAFYMKGDIVDDLTGGKWDGAGCATGNFSDISGAGVWANDLSVIADNSAPIEFWFSYVPYSPWSRNWRFYDDETVNNPTVGLNGAAENATPTTVDPEELIRLRMNFAELGGNGETDARKKLQYTSGCTPNTSETACTWTDVGDVTETTAVWRYASQANGDAVCASCNDNTAITYGLSGSTQNGTYITDKDAAAGANMDHNALAIQEYDYPLKAENVTGGVTYYFRAWDNEQQSRVYREQDNDGSNDCATSTCTYPSLTITSAATISIIRTTDGIISYGSVDLSSSTSTLPSAINDIETFQNDGTAAEKFSIKTTDATGGTTWTIGASPGTNIYTHSFATNTAAAWQILNTTDTYEIASSSVAVNGALNFYMKIDTPTVSGDYQQKSITVTVFAESAP